MTKPLVTIYTDGACFGNPGTGGYAAILVNGNSRRDIVGSALLTTNNRMELMAVIDALGVLKKPCVIHLYSDSRYVLDPLSERVGNERKIQFWAKNGWKTKANSPVKNRDLWKRLLTEFNKHEIHCHWVKGHNGDPLNERCDLMANQEAVMASGIDFVYEEITTIEQERQLELL